MGGLMMVKLQWLLADLGNVQYGTKQYCPHKEMRQSKMAPNLKDFALFVTCTETNR
jgi:hypothetical protein